MDVSRGVPESAWVLGWTFAVGQLFVLGEGGLSRDNEVSVGLSVVLSVLVVCWFSAGVLRARPVRVAIVWIVLGLSGLFGLIGALSDPAGTGGWSWLGLGATLVELAALYSFCSSDYYAEQREAAAGAVRPDIGGLLAIAVLVGFLGGIAAEHGTQARVHIGEL